MRQKICSVVLYLYVYITILSSNYWWHFFYMGEAQINHLWKHFMHGWDCISFSNISNYRSTFLGAFHFSSRIIHSLVCGSARYYTRLPWCLSPKGLRMRWWSCHSVCRLLLNPISFTPTSHCQPSFLPFSIYLSGWLLSVTWKW